MREYRFWVEDPRSLDLAGIVERLGAIVAYYRGSRGSTHERTKEVWGALKTLLSISEKKWGEWIPLIATRYTPSEFGKASDYFRQLLEALLRKFADEVKGYTPAMKSHLAKLIRSALDSASENPYPQLCFFIKEFYPDKELKEGCKEVVKA